IVNLHRRSPRYGGASVGGASSTTLFDVPHALSVWSRRDDRRSRAVAGLCLWICDSAGGFPLHHFEGQKDTLGGDCCGVLDHVKNRISGPFSKARHWLADRG